MAGWGDAETRTWLAMDLLAPVHQLWAALEAAPVAQVTAAGLLGEHRPELTEAALAGLVDLERALVVGAALDVAAGLVEPEVLVLVECALVDEACRLSLLPLVNAAADLLVELERDAGQNDAGQGDDSGALGLVGSGAPDAVGDPVPAKAAAGVRSDERGGVRVVVGVTPGRRSYRRDRGGGRGPARGPVVAAAARGGRRSRAPPSGRAVIRRWGAGPTLIVSASGGPYRRRDGPGTRARDEGQQRALVHASR